MMSLKLYKVINGPHVSEKSANLGEKNNQYVFKVATTATKPEIKAAVESLFSVSVVKVNTLNVKGKRKVFRGRPGQRKDYKKAVVTLSAGQEIDFVGAE